MTLRRTTTQKTDMQKRLEETSDLPRPKLLLVDDQPANLLTLNGVLDSLGYDLVEARSGEEALKRLLNEDFAVILMDVQMPGINGFEAAALIKQRPRTQFIPILFITAADDDEAFVAQAYKTGAVDYLRKPFDPATLRSKVSVFVDLYVQREQIRRQAELLRESEQREMALLQTMREREQEQRHLTEVAEHEARLRQFKTTLDATLDGVLLFAPDTFQCLYANQGAQRLIGSTAEELLARTLREILPALTPKQFERWIAPLKRAEQPSQTIESTVRRPDGTAAPVEVFLQYVLAEGGVGRFVCLMHDISERRRAEAEKASLQGEMQRMARKQRVFLREVLSGLTEGRLQLCDSTSELPAPLATYGEPIALSVPHLRTLRQHFSRAADSVGWTLERCQDFETALGEAAMNAVVHGRNARGRVCVNPTTGDIQVWIQDEGKGIAEDALHRATLERGYSSAGTLGHGFWMMLKTCERVYLLTGAAGTTVVLEQGKMPALPAWIQGYSVISDTPLLAQ